MPILPRHDHDEGPPAPGEYIVLLILLCVGAAGYILWWRKRSGSSTFALDNLRLPRSGVRLSTEDDGPTVESFLTNNASSDSLPLHLEQEVPFLPESTAAEAAALSDNLNESRFPRGEVNPISHHVASSPTSSAKKLNPLTPAQFNRELNPASHHNSTSPTRASTINAAVLRAQLASKSPSPVPSDSHPASSSAAAAPSAAPDPLGAGVEMTSGAPKYFRRSARAKRGPVEVSDHEEADSGDESDANRLFKLVDDDDDD